MLDIINEQDVIVGQAPIAKAHKEGLLHREVHVWFYTPKSEIIWQGRSKNKETFAGLLDATVGGHASAGQTPLEAAIRETKEETGFVVKPQDLTLLGTLRAKSKDTSTNLINNVIRYIYAYRFEGSVDDLKIEEGEITHFEVWPIEKMFSLDTEKSRFIAKLLDDENLEIYRKIQQLV